MPRQPKYGKPIKGMESMFGYGVVGAMGLLMIVALIYATTKGNLPTSGGQDGADKKPAATCRGGAPSKATMTRFLQALAAQESGGKLKEVSRTGAKGKYQYIDRTWKSHVDKYYPPASKYPTARDAPEEYQDAVTYIEYADKYRSYKGDLFKLAISHFYPAANNNSSLLDIVPYGNVVTPRQYANQFIKKVKNGTGRKIPIKAEKAPEFQKYLKKVGGSC